MSPSSECPLTTDLLDSKSHQTWQMSIEFAFIKAGDNGGPAA